MTAPRLRAVLFDAVGTLIALREPVGATYARLAAEFGARVPADRLEEAFARVLAKAAPLVFPGEPLARAAALEKEGWRRRVDDTFRSADGAALPRPFDGFFERAFTHYATAAAWELRPGALEALVALRSRGLATGIVSNFDQRLRPLLGELGVHHLFHAIVLPADVGAQKPDRAIFDAALKRLGFGGEDVAYVGDRAAEDVAASRAAGLRPIDVATLATLRELPRALQLVSDGPEGS
jgi:putative hydrolase of the HAD superfamily